MSRDGGTDMVTLKRMPVNRLAPTHCLLPSLCTRQSSWRFRWGAVLDNIAPWLGGPKARRRRGGSGGEYGSWDCRCRTRRWEEGRGVTLPIAIVRVCLLFIKLSPVIVIQITAGQYPQRTFSVHSFPCSLFDGLEALLYFTSSKSVAVNQKSQVDRTHAHNSLEPHF